MRTYGDFVTAAVAGGRPARFGAEAAAEPSLAARALPVAALLALTWAVVTWEKRTR